jgi:formate hydrogenlyase subunit 3/multisubunit Na+/H+ antiporter MnhD subunit
MTQMLFPLAVFAWCCVLGAALAVQRGRLHRSLVDASVALGIGFAAFGAFTFGSAALDSGRVLFKGAVAVDHFSAWIDALALLLAGLLSPSARAHGARAGVHLLAVWLGALAVCLAAHATDLASLILALEVSAMAGLGARAGGSKSSASGEARAQLVLAICSLLGAALILGASADLQLSSLPQRIAMVFNKWGGSQRWYAILMEDGATLPSGVVAQARGRVISGMAPASLLMPGILLVAVAVLARLLASGPLASAGRGFARLAALVILVRLFIAVLHAPRLVNEPYGWVGPLPSIAMVWMVWGAWGCVRARRLGDVNSGIARLHIGLVLLVLLLAANYYGHRALADGPVSAVVELAWAQRAGDDALAAALGLASLSFVGSALLLNWETNSGEQGPQRDALWRVDGLIRRDRLRSWSLTLVLVSLAGLPLSPIFVLVLASLRSLIEHSELRLLLPVVALLLTVAALGLVSVLGRVWWGQPCILEHEELGPPRRRARLDLCLVFGLAAMILGVAPETYLRNARVATAGLSQATESRGRAQWLRSSRLRWSGVSALEGLSTVESAPPDSGR